MWYDGWDRLTNKSVEVIPDSCLMAPLALLRRLNGLDAHLKLYFTEDDLCQRIRAAGYEIHYLADAMLWHEEHASVSQVQRVATRVYFDDLITFTRKYYGAGRAWLLRTLIIPTRWAMDAAQRLRGERARL
jgi:GT2 family glycosyltransferase